MTIFELVVICVVGITLGTIICWQSAILCVLISPILIIGMYKMATMQWGVKGGRKAETIGEGLDNYDKANALLSDIVINYRTVMSLGQRNVDSI